MEALRRHCGGIVEALRRVEQEELFLEGEIFLAEIAHEHSYAGYEHLRWSGVDLTNFHKEF